MEYKRIPGGRFGQSVRFEIVNTNCNPNLEDAVHETVSIRRSDNGISFGMEERFPNKPIDSPGVGNYKV